MIFLLFMHHHRRSHHKDFVQLLSEIKIEIKYTDGVQRIYLNGEDVSDKIRTETISLYASNVSKINEVRAFLLDLQRDIAKNQSVIMDGRDIGTVVCPHAEIKLFLSAQAETRAKRRQKELQEKGICAIYEDVLAEVKARDERDSNRAVAPLKPAQDAFVLDTSDLTIEEVYTRVLDFIKTKGLI